MKIPIVCLLFSCEFYDLDPWGSNVKVYIQIVLNECDLLLFEEKKPFISQNQMLISRNEIKIKKIT